MIGLNFLSPVVQIKGAKLKKEVVRMVVHFLKALFNTQWKTEDNNAIGWKMEGRSFL
jgi:hypothetical protein